MDIEEKPNSIKHWSSQDQPREKMIDKGSASLTDAELLAILINTGIKGKSALDLSKELLVFNNNNIAQLSRMSFQEIQKNFKGIGQAKAITIAAALELGRRRRALEDIKQYILSAPKDIFDYIMPLIVDSGFEEFWVVLTNRKMGVINAKQMFKGGIDSVNVDIRLILKYALEYNAVSLCVAHNHPSGHNGPSQADIAITEKIKKACDVIGINFLDHIIVADHLHYYSFADNGLI
jgi:DNA repair protein RadC